MEAEDGAVEHLVLDDMANQGGELVGPAEPMARIHGLLYITGAALSMDDIIETLDWR